MIAADDVGPVPLLLVLGAPITLAMRAIGKRRDGSRGGREWMLAIVHSRYLQVIGHPVVAAVIDDTCGNLLQLTSPA